MIQVMKQALEALETAWYHVGTFAPTDEAIDLYDKARADLRKAIAEAEKEPVAWITGGGNGELWWHQSSKFDEEGNLIGNNPDDIPLYTSPPQRQWVGLTDEQISAIDWKQNETLHDFARAIEAKLKEKNA